MGLSIFVTGGSIIKSAGIPQRHLVTMLDLGRCVGCVQFGTFTGEDASEESSCVCHVSSEVVPRRFISHNVSEVIREEG